MSKFLNTAAPYIWLLLLFVTGVLFFLGVASTAEKRIEKYIKSEFQVMPADVHRVSMETLKTVERIEQLLSEK